VSLATRLKQSEAGRGEAVAAKAGLAVVANERATATCNLQFEVVLYLVTSLGCPHLSSVERCGFACLFQRSCDQYVDA